MRPSITIFLCAAVLPMHSAFADWALVGAASTCTSDRFAVEGIVESSGGNIYPSAGAKRLTKIKNSVQCSIAKSRIEAMVLVSPPSAAGGCGSAGMVWLEALKINGKNFLKEPGFMNDYCSMHSTYSKIEVLKDGKFLFINLCTGMWEWGSEFENEKCEVTKIANPSYMDSPQRQGN